MAEKLTDISESNKRKSRLASLAGRFALVGSILTGVFSAESSTFSATAEARSNGVYAPVSSSVAPNMAGWANVTTDCSGTLACYTFVKLEEVYPDYLYRKDGYTQTGRYVNGTWAHNGWNEVAANINNCGYFRTVVDTYNDEPADSAIHINLGILEFGGSAVKRYHEMQESAAVYICPPSYVRGTPQ